MQNHSIPGKARAISNFPQGQDSIPDVANSPTHWLRCERLQEIGYLIINIDVHTLTIVIENLLLRPSFGRFFNFFNYISLEYFVLMQWYVPFMEGYRNLSGFDGWIS